MSLAQAPALEWQSTFGGTGDDTPYSIRYTADGGSIAIGHTYSRDHDVPLNHGAPGTADCWVVKITATGMLDWQKTYGGSDWDSGQDIIQTPDGGFVFVALCVSTDGDVISNHGSSDIWLVKINSTGIIQWQKSLGGSYDDIPESISATADGGYIITGRSNSLNGDVTGHHGPVSAMDVWVVKTDNLGAIQWQHSLGGTEKDIGNSVKQTMDGGYILVGTTASNDGDVSFNHSTPGNGITDYWVVKLDMNGTIQWEKSLGGSEYDGATDVIQNSSGNYIIAGYSGSDDGDVTNLHSTYDDAWIVELDAAGGLIWQKTYGGSDGDGAKSITEVNNGYVIGGGTGSSDGDVTISYGSSDYWIIRIDTSGILQWQTSLGGPGSQNLYAARQAGSGEYIVAGNTAGSGGQITLHYGVANDFWIVKLQTPVGLKPLTSADLSLYPNPVSDRLYINTRTASEECNLNIYDSMGQLCMSQQFIGAGSWDLNHLASGLYTARVDGNTVHTASTIVVIHD
jgi:hypothetical protein